MMSACLLVLAQTRERQLYKRQHWFPASDCAFCNQLLQRCIEGVLHQDTPDGSKAREEYAHTPFGSSGAAPVAFII